MFTANNSSSKSASVKQINMADIGLGVVIQQERTFNTVDEFNAAVQASPDILIANMVYKILDDGSDRSIYYWRDRLNYAWEMITYQNLELPAYKLGIDVVDTIEFISVDGYCAFVTLNYSGDIKIKSGHEITLICDYVNNSYMYIVGYALRGVTTNNHSIGMPQNSGNIYAKIDYTHPISFIRTGDSSNNFSSRFYPGIGLDQLREPRNSGTWGIDSIDGWGNDATINSVPNLPYVKRFTLNKDQYNAVDTIINDGYNPTLGLSTIMLDGPHAYRLINGVIIEELTWHDISSIVHVANGSKVGSTLYSVRYSSSYESYYMMATFSGSPIYGIRFNINIPDYNQALHADMLSLGGWIEDSNHNIIALPSFYPISNILMPYIALFNNSRTAQWLSLQEMNFITPTGEVLEFNLTNVEILTDSSYQGV